MIKNSFLSKKIQGRRGRMPLREAPLAGHCRAPASVCERNGCDCSGCSDPEKDSAAERSYKAEEIIDLIEEELRKPARKLRIERKVLIVQEGRWGALDEVHYRNFIEYICLALAEEGVSVEVAATRAEAEEKVRKERADTVIFISREMGDAAEAFAAKFPLARIVVLTGLIPAGKVVWAHKLWVADPKFLRKVVLS